MGSTPGARSRGGDAEGARGGGHGSGGGVGGMWGTLGISRTGGEHPQRTTPTRSRFTEGPRGGTAPHLWDPRARKARGAHPGGGPRSRFPFPPPHNFGTHLSCCARSAPVWAASCPARPPGARRGHGGARGKAAPPPPRPPPAAPRRRATPPPPSPGRGGGDTRRREEGARWCRLPPPTASRGSGGPRTPPGQRLGGAGRPPRHIPARSRPGSGGSGGSAPVAPAAAAIEERGAGSGAERGAAPPRYRDRGNASGRGGPGGRGDPPGCPQSQGGSAEGEGVGGEG